MKTSDLHTHTIISGHAYSTLLENIDYCAKNNIEILGTSDHAPSMPHAPHKWYFGNLRVLPRYINGVMVLKGCEANILNEFGEIDITSNEINKLDYIIASLHEAVIPATAMNEEQATNAVINAITRNKKIEILGHLGNPNYQLDYRRIIEEAKKKDIMVEINNSSLSGTSRPGSDKNCEQVARLCKEIGTKVILTSDAHFCFSIGEFTKGKELLKKVEMPENLIMNEPSKLIKHLKSKGALSDL